MSLISLNKRSPGISRLSIRALLLILAIVPLIVLVLLAGSQAWSNYQDYETLQRAQLIQRLANGGASLALALPHEALSDPAGIPDARKQTDAVLTELFAAYDAMTAGGISDPTMNSEMDIIRAGRDKLVAYRTHVDQKTATSDEALFILQPVSAAGLGLVAGASAMVGDLDLARYLEGLHALLQTNDAGLIEINLGKAFLTAGALPAPEFAFVIHAKDLREIYSTALQGYLPAAAIAPYLQFAASPQGATVDTVRKALYLNQPVAGSSSVSVDQWMQAVLARTGILAGVITAATAGLQQLAQGELDGARDALIGNIAIALALMLVISTQCVWSTRNISRALRGISARMNSLTEGDTESAIPFGDRKDEIGEMARAVEVFRANSKAVREMDSERDATRRGESEQQKIRYALQTDVARVVSAAASGDFSLRITDDYRDQELNALATSVNNLVETVDRGLTETGNALAALADTDLTQRVDGQYQGAFLHLKDNTNAVADKLNQIVGQLRNSSRSLKTATSEILSGANDLSERTTKQAATIEETSAAMEQLASTVLHNARKADEASQKSHAVSLTAEQGGEVMLKANAAMDRITSSSSKISNIIGLIDDIAFQTNLLALNASVEAARAGEMGKGFAVVAVEVRRLAQSAAQASSEVKALIEQSASEVSGGSKLVADASGKLSAIVAAIRENNQLVEDIARDSKGQAAAIEDVNKSVRQMEEMTQHNAALVEETNAAIEQSEAQANELDRIVDIFRIADGVEKPAGAHPATRAAAPLDIKALGARLADATKSYRNKSNAAVAKEWSEF